MGYAVSPSSARAAQISPTTLANLKPWPEREEHVARDPELGRDGLRERAHPGTRRKHEPRGIELTGLGLDADALHRRLPAFDGLLEAQGRAVRFGETKVRLDAALRCEPSGLPLDDAGPALEPLEHREPRAKIVGVEQLVLEAVAPHALEGAPDELPVGRSCVEAAGLG